MAKREPEIDVEQAKRELEMLIGIGIAAIAKASCNPGESGKMACPRCRSGTLTYSRASSNGHVRAWCDRDTGIMDGDHPVSCVAVVE